MDEALDHAGADLPDFESMMELHQRIDALWELALVLYRCRQCARRALKGHVQLCADGPLPAGTGRVAKTCRSCRTPPRKGAIRFFEHGSDRLKGQRDLQASDLPDFERTKDGFKRKPDAAYQRELEILVETVREVWLAAVSLYLCRACARLDILQGLALIANGDMSIEQPMEPDEDPSYSPNVCAAGYRRICMDCAGELV